MTDITFRMKCKAFRGAGVKEHVILIDDEEIRVWDDVAEIFSTKHALCPSAIAKAKRLAMVN